MADWDPDKINFSQMTSDDPAFAASDLLTILQMQRRDRLSTRAQPDPEITASLDRAISALEQYLHKTNHIER